jgi:hypothetical protein
MVTQQRLKELLHYDEETGKFTWMVKKGRIKPGHLAGSVNNCGYVHICIDRKHYKASRLAWLYVYGHMPSSYVDHVNRIRTDDRISNLRLASANENSQNRKMNSKNKSGISGVSWHKRTSKWTAQIMVNGEKIYLGIFETIEDAAAARSSAKEKYHTFNPEDYNEKVA